MVSERTVNKTMQCYLEHGTILQHQIKARQKACKAQQLDIVVEFSTVLPKLGRSTPIQYISTTSHAMQTETQYTTGHL